MIVNFFVVVVGWQYLDAFLRNHSLSASDEDFTRRVWAGTKIETCQSYLAEADLFRKFSRSEFVKLIVQSMEFHIEP